MIKRLVLLLIICLFLPNISEAQRNVRDSSIFMPLVSIDYSALFPAADFNERFGYTNGLGLTVDFKTKKNFIYGLHSNFLFGSKVKQTDQFEPMVNSDGTVSNFAGGIAAISLKMRGFNVNFDFGYLFTFQKPNPNSGLFLKLGVGFLHNMIYIQNIEEDVPQFNGEYKKGYDQLSMGINLSQNIGYQYIHSKGIWNFHVGLYIMEGMTKNVRYNYYTKSKNPTLQLDMMFGLKAGWIIPIYKRTAEKYYYN
jgi:hypothetical protein